MVNLDSRLIDGVNILVTYLRNIKNDLDEYDKTHLLDEQNKYIKLLYPEFKKKLDEHFTKTSQMFDGYGKEFYKVNQEYYIKSMWDYLYRTRINKHIYDKPLGYPGDFMLMNYILDYQNELIGDTSYEKLVNLYSLKLPFCLSNVARREYIKSIVLDIMTRKQYPSITSVACGSIRELLDIRDSARFKEINCVDFEPKVFDYIKNELKNAPFQNGTKIEFILKDVIEMVRGKETNTLIKDQDFIYFSGIFDYLPDRIAKKVCSSFFPLLKEGGNMLICNCSKKNKQLHSYYEVLGKWEMVYRNEDDLINMVSDLNPTKCRFDRPPDGSCYNFLLIEK